MFDAIEQAAGGFLADATDALLIVDIAVSGIAPDRAADILPFPIAPFAREKLRRLGIVFDGAGFVELRPGQPRAPLLEEERDAGRLALIAQAPRPVRMHRTRLRAALAAC